MIKLIALDMDGTLLNDEWDVTPFTKEMIAKAKAQGIKVILSTGRPFSRCTSYMDDLNLDSYTITANGAQIYNPDRQIKIERTMDSNKIEKLADIAEEVGVDAWFITTEKVFHHEKDIDFNAHKFLKMGFANLSEADKETVMGKLEKLTDIEITNSLPDNIEVNEAGINKANALKTVADALNIKMAEVFAIGDSMNDFAMIKAVGKGIAMGNAQDVIKLIALDIVDDNNHDGVGKAIEKHVLNA